MSNKVFLVDDDIDLVEQYKLSLTESGFEVASSHTAKEAVEKLKTETPDLIVLDVMMESRMAGFILAREIGKTHKNLPVIILSGDTEKACWMGETDDTWQPIVKFLEKPLSPNALCSEIKKVLKNG